MSERHWDPDRLRALVPEAEEALRFFSSSRKKERERWVLDQWLLARGMTAVSIEECEGPDFIVDGVPVEIVEVLLPGRKRGDEYREDRDLLEQGKPGKVRDFVDLHLVKEQAHRWVLEAVLEKAQRYRTTARRWTLVVYADYDWSEHTDWTAVGKALAETVDTFSDIWVLRDQGDAIQLGPS